jgi:hypothetical protein
VLVPSIPRPKRQLKALSHQVAARADEKASRKRKRISSTDPLIYSPRPSKRNNTSKITKRFCWELDHGVSGFVSNVKGSIGLDLANNILEYPIPDTAMKQLVKRTSNLPSTSSEMQPIPCLAKIPPRQPFFLLVQHEPYRTPTT